MCVLYPAYLNRSARVTSSKGNPHGMRFVSSSYCIPVRNVSRPVIIDAFCFIPRAATAGGEEEEEEERRKRKRKRRRSAIITTLESVLHMTE